MGKIKRNVFLVLCIGLIVLSYFNLNSYNSLASDSSEVTKEILNINYVEHDPIIINSNDDFVTYGFSGNGSSTNPYTIENYSITGESEYGIKICCISVFYIIRNCYISLYYNTSTYAIYLEDADDLASVINNTCEANYFGLYLNRCGFMDIVNNTFIFNTRGIYAFNSYGLDISNNYIANSFFWGIDCYNCQWITLENNTIFRNLMDGIKFHYTHTSVIKFNLLEENIVYGVFLSSNTYDVLVFFNNFVDNAGLFEAQAYDSGENNTWFEIVSQYGNYWSDIEQNCIYELDGTADSFDMYPLNRSFECTDPPTYPTSPTTNNLSIEFILITLTAFALPLILKIRRRKR